MSVRGAVARGGISFGVLAALLVACSPNPNPVGPDPNKLGGNKGNEATKEWERCNAQAEQGDATACWKTWLDEYQATGTKAEVAYAQRMAAPHPTNPSGGDKPPPHPDDHPGGPKVIAIDENRPSASKPPSTSDNPFPPQTAGYGDCWKGARLTGDYVADYNNLVGACGKPTGMLPFSKPMTGELGDDHKGDVYTVKLAAGGCYRFFAVAGGSIKDIDIAIASMENKIIAADKYTQPVAIIEWQKPICVENDVQFKFIIARDGSGSGGYGFGIWFKPAGA